MTTYASVAIALNGPADDSARLDFSGSTYTSIQLQQGGGVDPAYPRGGSLALGLSVVSLTGHFDLTGNTLAATFLAALNGVVAGTVALQGNVMLGRFIPLTAVYRNGDRLTLAGYALNLAGQRLRQVQVQFIGQSVQNHFFGSATDLDGVYVAYLEQGDTYTAYAFSPTTGITYRLDSQQVLPNQTNLTFRQVTKRAASGEGLFRQGG